MALIGRNPWAFALLYMGLSMALEIVLIVVGRLRVPDDNAVIAPVLLTVAPLLAAGLSGYRRPASAFLTVAGLAASLTLVLTLGVNRLTGISTGMLEPILNRTAAGWLAAAITNRALANRDR